MRQYRKVNDLAQYCEGKCREIARDNSLFQRVFIYAVISDRNNRILSEARNDYNQSCSTQRYYSMKVGMHPKKFNHAECHAIHKLRTEDLDKAYRINIVRIDRNGEVTNSKPCPICEEAIRDIGIKYIEYTI